MRASSPLLYGRLCVIIAVTILLFLPLTFTANNNNSASAQTSPGPLEGLFEEDSGLSAEGALPCLFGGLECSFGPGPQGNYAAVLLLLLAKEIGGRFIFILVPFFHLHNLDLLMILQFLKLDLPICMKCHWDHLSVL